MKTNFTKITKKRNRNWKEQQEFQQAKRKGNHRQIGRKDPWIESIFDKENI